MVSTSSTTATPPARPRPPPLPNTAPSLASAARGEALVRRGQTGDSVRELQEQLKARGFQVTVDGKFGPETDAAVRAFQQSSGAKVDGLVGPETMGKLFGPCHSGISDGVDKQPAAPGAPRRAPTEDDRRAVAPAGTLRAGDLARADDARRARGPGDGAPAGAIAPLNASEPVVGGVNPPAGAIAPPSASEPVVGGVNPPAGAIAPLNASERERYDHYAAIVRANGGQVCADGKPTVLGLRGLSRDGTQHDTTSARAYDDTFVVLTPDGHVREFSGATHPGQNRSTMSPDVTGDGVGDVGMIRPGNYQVVPNGEHAGAASFHVRTTGGSGNLSGWRDTNQDGRFSDAERAASERRGDTLNGVLFHQGGTGAPTSIGCQTMSPSTYSAFLDAVGGRGFSYTLVG